MRYLLAAEADKIQDFIFRSSRLREVVGASELLSRFCRSEGGALTLAKTYEGELIVNDGGGFRVVFDGIDAKRHAKDFGADLSELYRLSLGGSISVAEPVEFNGDFRAANDRAGRNLRRAKSHLHGSSAEPHMPFMALCASCGVTLANHFGQLPNEPSNSQRYLCQVCQTKAQERWDERLGHLHKFLVDVIGSESHLDQYTWPDDTDQVAAYDLRSRNYVAYLVADGNGMGTLFGLCDATQIRTLSDGLTNAVRSSMASVSSSLIARLERRYNENKREIVPVLPLILGGDDLFALIPAPYSLDFAQRFCLAWETQLLELVKNAGLEIGQGEGKIPRPTVAAAVVICKSKYPYALAHRRAEQLLKDAKRHGKLLAAETGEHLSTVNFEVILSNHLAGEEETNEERRNVVQTTLRPYWVATNEPLSEAASKRGIELQQLLDQRFALNNTPNKRLIELRRRFEDLPDAITLPDRDAILEVWTKDLQTPIKRSGKTTGQKLEQALEALGKEKGDGNGAHNWREVRRTGGKPLVHGMLDLLEVWDFAQDLDYAPAAYEAKEEEA